MTTSEDEYIMQRVKIGKKTLLTSPVTYLPSFLLLNMIYSIHLRKSYGETMKISTKLQFENISQTTCDFDDITTISDTFFPLGIESSTLISILSIQKQRLI